MATTRKPSPRDFPMLHTVKEWHHIYRGTYPPRTPGVCPVCRLAMDPRLVQRHAKACGQRKRLAPDMWREWHSDMHGLPVPCCRCHTKQPRAQLAWDEAGNAYCTNVDACAARQARAYQQEQARRR